MFSIIYKFAKTSEKQYIRWLYNEGINLHLFRDFGDNLTFNNIAFNFLFCRKYETSFRETNSSARKFNKQLGYREISCINGFVRVSITNESYKKAKDRLIRFFRK